MGTEHDAATAQIVEMALAELPPSVAVATLTHAGAMPHLEVLFNTAPHGQTKDGFSVFVCPKAPETEETKTLRVLLPDHSPPEHKRGVVLGTTATTAPHTPADSIVISAGVADALMQAASNQIPVICIAEMVEGRIHVSAIVTAFVTVGK